MSVTQELERIVDFINLDNNGASSLFSILSALRGPDNQSDDIDPDADLAILHYWKRVKLATTAVIRHHVGLTYTGIDINPDSPEHVKTRLGLIQYSHFTQHARSAFAALGLRWDMDNSALPIAIT